MNQPASAGLLKILLVEDNPADAQLILELCREAPDCAVEIRHVATMAEAVQTLARGGVDVVLQDLILPDSSAEETLARAGQMARTIPVVVLSGLDDFQLASQAVYGGIQDYLVKGQVDYRTLYRSIRYARERLRAMQDKDLLVSELRDTLRHIKRLQGLLPICAACKKIRDYQGCWEEVEQYVQAHSEASFTHSICPDCSRRLYPELFADKRTGS